MGRGEGGGGATREDEGGQKFEGHQRVITCLPQELRSKRSQLPPPGGSWDPYCGACCGVVFSPLVALELYTQSSFKPVTWRLIPAVRAAVNMSA